MIDLAATIEAMKASGMTSEEIVRALACVQSVETMANARTARQERNRRYYENRKASEKRLNASEQDVSDEVDVGKKESPQTPKEKQEPQKENTPLRGVQKKKGHRLPSDFAMPDEWRDWAIGRGLPPERVPIEFEKLTNWAANAGSNGVKSDWFKAWRNWVIEAIDRLPPRNRAGPQSPAKLPQMADVFKMIKDTENGRQEREDRSGTGSVVSYLPAVGSR